MITKSESTDSKAGRWFQTILLGILVLFVCALCCTPGAFAQGSVPPSITSPGPFAVDEGQTDVGQLTADDSDTDAADLTWSKTGGADEGKFALSTSGSLTFSAAKDYENPEDADADGVYEVTVQVSDGESMVAADLVVTVENVIELLTTITGETSVSFTENSATRIATFTASSEEDREGVEWVLSGTDGDDFSIDSPAGALRFDIDPVDPKIFAEPPDFEDPDDANADNVYSITLLARVGTKSTSSLDVAVTVTDGDDPGILSLSSPQPRVDMALTAVLTDADGVTEGATSWKWERNDGREGWLKIDGATSASYTPAAADGDRYLRASATYTDDFGSDKTAVAMAPHVVIAHQLSSLSFTGLTGVTNDDRAFYPDFDRDVLHYAARCTETVTLTLQTEDTSTRLSVNGVQRPTGQAFTVAGLGGESDIRMTLTGADGASTTYTVQCIDRQQFPKLTTEKEDGATDDLMMFRAKWRPAEGWRSSLVIMDNNGVPRLRKLVYDNVYEYFRVFPDETHPRARYAYTKYGASYRDHGVEMVVLDKYFKVEDEDIHVLSPFNTTDGHDQIILPNGDYVLMAHSLHSRDLSFIQTAFPGIGNVNEVPLGTQENVEDGAIQVRTAGGAVKFNWSSWDHMAIEDCIPGSVFDFRYAHLNSLGLIDGDIIAGFRKCSKILRIDSDTGKVVWRAGPSILSREQWEAGETLKANLGPAPLDFINDPRGGFSGQHGGHMNVDGNLLVYDNATHCGVPPGIPDDAKGVIECDDRVRAVEYAIDETNGELVFLSEFLMPETDPPKTVGGFAGHAEPMDNGDWMISWSNPIRSMPSAPMPNTAMQVDPKTGTEKLSMTLQNIIGDRGVNQPHHTRVVMVSPVALAPRVEPLSARFPASTSTSVFHMGATDSPKVVVAFNRPVIDFDENSPSLDVTGATVASVSPHIATGEPSNAYLITLTPDGDGAITFSLAANKACADEGICTADGATLTEVPQALGIVAPITVSFRQSLHSVSEGHDLNVTVELSSAHRSVRTVTIPVSASSTQATSGEDYSGAEAVTFDRGRKQKTIRFRALADNRVEGPEAVIINFGDLPGGVTEGSVTNAEITLIDSDHARPTFDVLSSEVPEGGETQVTFGIDNGVVFEDDQQINLTLGGSATPEDDFFLLDANNRPVSAPYAITFPALTSSVQLTLFVVDDDESESAVETVTLSATITQPDGPDISLGTRTTPLPPSDLPDTPSVTIFDAASVTEGMDASFELSRTNATNTPFTEPLTILVQVTATGSTLLGRPPSNVTFETNSSTASLQVATLDDAVIEDASEVRAMVLADRNTPPSYVVGSANLATGTVNDNDVPAFRVSSSSAELPEGRSASVAVETVGVTFADDQSLTLTIAGTATPGQDFTVGAPDGKELLDPYEFMLPAGERSVRVTIKAARDSEDDLGETVEVSISHGGNPIGTTTITIIAARPAPISNPVSGGGGGGGPANRPPGFHDADGNEITEISREIPEDAALGSNVGEPVSATDPDGDTLTYTVSGNDTASFTIDPSTSQLTTATVLDHESRASYSVTVVATDPSGATAEVQVAITVTAVSFDCSTGDAVGTPPTTRAWWRTAKRC